MTSDIVSDLALNMGQKYRGNVMLLQRKKPEDLKNGISSHSGATIVGITQSNLPYNSRSKSLYVIGEKPRDIEKQEVDSVNLNEQKEVYKKLKKAKIPLVDNLEFTENGIIIPYLDNSFKSFYETRAKKFSETEYEIKHLKLDELVSILLNDVSLGVIKSFDSNYLDKVKQKQYLNKVNLVKHLSLSEEDFYSAKIIGSLPKLDKNSDLEKEILEQLQILNPYFKEATEKYGTWEIDLHPDNLYFKEPSDLNSLRSGIQIIDGLNLKFSTMQEQECLYVDYFMPFKDFDGNIIKNPWGSYNQLQNFSMPEIKKFRIDRLDDYEMKTNKTIDIDDYMKYLPLMRFSRALHFLAPVLKVTKSTKTKKDISLNKLKAHYYLNIATSALDDFNSEHLQNTEIDKLGKNITDLYSL